MPHFKDEYWLSVGYGLEQEADRQNAELLFFEAGGYRAPAQQVGQIEGCVQRGVDAILIGAVTSDHPDLMDAVARASQTVPVFGLVNALNSDEVSGRVGVDWRDMGQTVGRHLVELSPGGSAPRTAILVSGPDEASWTGLLEAGLRVGLADSAVEIIAVYGADTGLRQQLALVETALHEHPDADYLIGSAPAIEAAIGLLATRTGAKRPQLLSTYMNHTVQRGLMNGSVLAASFDDPVAQGVMAIRQMISPTGFRAPVGPEIVLLTDSDAGLERISMPPADYFPKLQ